ncbi:hypothetical protein Micbo1qcDRAFT_169732, partial [Microdochium bolleyi]
MRSSTRMAQPDPHHTLSQIGVIGMSAVGKTRFSEWLESSCSGTVADVNLVEYSPTYRHTYKRLPGHSID